MEPGYVRWPFGRGGRRRPAREPVPARRLTLPRARGPFESEHERFEGATVLDDMLWCGRERGGAVRVLARCLTLGVVLRADAGELTGAALARECGWAAEYVRVAWREGDREAEALLAVLRAAEPGPGRELLRALHRAGVEAGRRGHLRGGYALERTCYRLALARNWPAEAARAARAIAEIAGRVETAAAAARLWRRRAAVLERRANRVALAPLPPAPSGAGARTVDP